MKGTPLGEDDLQGLVDQPQRQERLVQRAAGLQDHHPGIEPDDQAGEEGQGDQEEEEVLRALGQAADPEGDRIAGDQAEPHREQRQLQRAQEDDQVDGVVFLDQSVGPAENPAKVPMVVVPLHAAVEARL
jgi:hypothetical protein